MNSVLDQVATDQVSERPEDRDSRGKPLPLRDYDGSLLRCQDRDQFERRLRSGTQDRIVLNCLYGWYPGEERALQEEVARRTGQPFARVRFVVSLYLHFRVHPVGREDWKICRAAHSILDDPEEFAKFRKPIADSCWKRWTSEVQP